MMKTRVIIAYMLLVCSLALAQGTAFIYQGRLAEAGGPAHGIYDLQFTLYDAASNGSVVGVPITKPSTQVTNGLLMLTLDFGAGGFTGSNRWLEVAVRTNGALTYTALNPLQPLTPAPYAIMANSASNLLGILPAAQLSGALSSAQLSGTYSNTITFRSASGSFAGTFAGDGAGLTNVVGGPNPGDLWRLNGNSVAPGQFLGSTNYQPLELWANGYRVWRVEPDPGGSFAGNLIGGYTNNTIEWPSGGNVIGGGGWAGGINVIRSNSRGNFIGAGSANRIGPNVNDAVIDGGNGNQVEEFYGVIGGGFQNAIQRLANYSVIGGGTSNQIGTNSSSAVIAGGGGNTIQAYASDATISGGHYNLIQPGNYITTVAGGYRNTIASPYASIGGGAYNSIGTNSNSGTISGGFAHNIGNQTFDGTIGGGSYATIGNNSSYSTVGGGRVNSIGHDATSATIAGGFENAIQNGAAYGTIAGGGVNSIAGEYGTVPGGFGNSATGRFAFAAGYRAQANHHGAFVWSDARSATPFESTASNQFNVRAAGGVRFVTSGAGVTVDGMPLVSSSKEVLLPDSPGLSNVVNVVHGSSVNFVSNGVVGATISGGGAGYYFNAPFSNSISGHFGTIGGGIDNRIVGNWYVTIGGGSDHTASGDNATIAGGRQNVAAAYSATVGGGVINRSSGNQSTVAGGAGNTASGHSATVPGGQDNLAAGHHSFAAGYRAAANHNGAFVWADSVDVPFGSTAPNQFLIRAAGNVGIGTTAPGAALDVRTTSGTGNAIRFGYYSGGVGNLIAGPSRVAIATGDDVERISIPQGTGNVGLGTLSPAQKLHVIGNILASGTITPNSDVNAKTNFAAVNVADILDRVTRLSIQQWRFKAEPAGVKHMGPMAQEFRETFGLGEIPTAIATVDADGVALAAIQGLYQKLEEKNAELQELKQQLASLKATVQKLVNAK